MPTDNTKLAALAIIVLVFGSIGFVRMKEYFDESTRIAAERAQIAHQKEIARTNQIRAIGEAVANAKTNAEKVIACRAHGGTPDVTIFRGRLKDCIPPPAE